MIVIAVDWPNWSVTALGARVIGPAGAHKLLTMAIAVPAAAMSAVASAPQTAVPPIS